MLGNLCNAVGLTSLQWIEIDFYYNYYNKPTYKVVILLLLITIGYDIINNIRTES